MIPIIRNIFRGIRDICRNRKAQFFIITVVLVAGSLSITMNILDDYQDIEYDQSSSSVAVSQFKSVARSFDSLWYSEEWKFRRAISIDAVRGLKLDKYPLSMTVNTSALIEDGKMRENCKDLRIGRNGRQIPFQIEEGTCNTENTKIWFLYTAGDRYNLYYGNSDIEKPVYHTDLEWDSEKKVLENSLVRLKIGSAEGGKGFVEARRKGLRDLAPEGRIIERSDITKVDEGPIYTILEFDSGNSFRLFDSNPFIRREGPVTLSISTPLWYASNANVMTHWEANTTDQKAINANGDTFSGTISGTSLPYIAALNPGRESLILTTDTTGIDSELDEYIGEASGGEFSFGLGSSSREVTVPYLDYIIGRGGVSRSAIRRHTEPPKASLSRMEEEGSFKLSDGWSTKKKVSVEDHSGEFLPNHPINLSLNLGEMDLREDCSDLVVVEEDIVRPHVIKGPCDSLNYDEPKGFTSRFPLDRGRGSIFNSSDGVFNGRLEDQSKWDVGRFELGLDLEKGYAVIEESPRIELKGGSFTVSLWFKANATAQDYTRDVGLVQYPESTPSLEIVEDSNRILLEGRFRNESGRGNVVRGSTDLSSLDLGWHHVAMVYDSRGSNMSIFLDGEIDGTGDIKGNLKQEDDTVDLGRGFNGSMDEVKFYKKALGKNEIRDQYVTTTDMVFLANISSGKVNRDISIFGGAPAGLSEDSSGAFSNMKARAADDVVKPTRAVSDVRQYREIASDMERVIGSSSDIGSATDIEIDRGCSRISFDDGRFTLTDRVC